jgi:hypothetical protein
MDDKQIPEYNQIDSEQDDLTVIEAKLEAIKKQRQQQQEQDED